jgi:hypothetical protein
MWGVLVRLVPCRYGDADAREGERRGTTPLASPREGFGHSRRCDGLPVRFYLARRRGFAMGRSSGSSPAMAGSTLVKTVYRAPG